MNTPNPGIDIAPSSPPSGPRRYLASIGNSLLFLSRSWPYWLLAAIFLVTAGRFALATPPFESVNEPQHYLRVENTLGQRQPLIRETSCAQWETSGIDESPLYYVIGAAVTRWIGDSSPPHTYQPNPLARLNSLEADAERNAVLHIARPAPWSGGAISRLYLLRLLSMVCGAGVALLGLAIARQILPDRPDIALGCAALVALNPQFLFLSASANPTAMRTLLITATGWMALRSLVRRITLPYGLALGLLAGMAGLAGAGGMVALALVVATYVLAWRRSCADRLNTTLLPGGLSLSLTVGLSAWWWSHRLTQGGVQQALSDVRTWFDLSLPDLLMEGQRAILTRWGVFGWRNVMADEPLYVALEAISVLGIAGLLLLVARSYWRRGRLALGTGGAAMLLATWMGLATLTLLGRGRPLWGDGFWALVPGALLLSAGLAAWLSSQRGWAIIVPVMIILGATAWIAPQRYIARAYAAPDTLTLEEVPTTIHDLHISFVEGPFLLGYEIRNEPQAGGDLQLSLYWLARQRMRVDVSAVLTLYGREESSLVRINVHPGGGNYPTSRWIPGQVIEDRYRLSLPEEMEAPTAAVLRVGVYIGCKQQIASLPAMDAGGRYIGIHPRIARVPVAPTVQMTYAPLSPTQVNFGDKIQLVGYDLPDEVYHAGSALRTALYWQALVPMERDYTLFAHLLDENGTMVAQVDEEPQQGDYSTHFWRPGEQIRDKHTLVLPQDLPAGTYTLCIGLYWLESGERLPIVSSPTPSHTGEPATHFAIDGVRVEAAP